MQWNVADLLERALAEDIGPGDLTTAATVPEDARCTAVLTAKADGVLSGIELFRAVFDRLEAGVCNWRGSANGTRIAVGDTVATFSGLTRAVLTGERVALNLTQRLSGVATLTARYCDAIAGTDAVIVDTRKTTPLLREWEKAAVRHGGGRNHRFALYDGVLIKDNHIVAAGGVRPAVEAARASAHHLVRIQVEAATPAQVDEAIAAGADAILLDNMAIGDLQEAVKRTSGAGVVLEASGDMSLDRVREVARTGVHLISVGALTHSAPALNLSLEIRNE